MENDNKEQFIEELKKASEERFAEELRQRRKTEIQGENIYKEFCVWCMAFNHKQGENDGKTFKRFLDEQNYSLTNYQRYFLAKKYFNYKGAKNYV